jgi:signal transduction histidine kinase
MIREVAFQTRARTVDHLGREQIADTPTAVSELWKNSYDAYARRVELNIYDSVVPVALLCDDGHGMNRDEFVDRWLVVGTESKATAEQTPIEDRNGLPVRPRQGQKGIGRLSCANLGPTLLLISKRRKQPFVVALLDWRLFENPYLNLADILIPVTEVNSTTEVLDSLPELIQQLRENVAPKSPGERSERIRKCWAQFDRLTADAQSDPGALTPSPSSAILSTVDELEITAKHLEPWAVWNGTSEHGTAMVVCDVVYDLRIQLSSKVADIAAKATRDRFFETLSSFVDPYANVASPEINATDPQFSYAVRAWNGNVPRLILGSEKQFDRYMVEGMEHRLEGVVDKDGIFRGKVKAFGNWIEETVVIEAPKDLEIGRRSDQILGPFDIFIASMEFQALNTSHSKAEFEYFADLAERYAGFMIFRDGLRVMPYGRTDNDFFEIEMRRSKSVGREFWNHRQMFGRLAISRHRNPNLKDKAGREGLLDNRAAKTLKEIVSNILMQSARRYFGSASDLRKELLPEIRKSNEEERASEARNKLRKRQRKEFRAKLTDHLKVLPTLEKEVLAFAEKLEIAGESDIESAQAKVESIRDRLVELRLPGVPKVLGALEGQFASYRGHVGVIQRKLGDLDQALSQRIEEIRPARPKALLERQQARHAAQIHHRIQGWKKQIEALQKVEFERVRELISERNKLFHSESSPVLLRFDRGDLSYAEASKLLELLKNRLDADNEDIFTPYIGALESLRESIDLQHLAAFGLDELADMRVELDRLNSLAQLGIAVEIVGHELESYDQILGSGLRALPVEVQNSKAAKDIEFGYEGLTDQLRFLSPLRLAGQQVQDWITGSEIADYVAAFFKLPLANNHIRLNTMSDFRALRIFENRSRILPVFINLINNSIYWLGLTDRSDREIRLSVSGARVIVSDNGPGVAPEDTRHLFSLFFTKKVRGGRGVGLYLSKANLVAGGHRIEYLSGDSNAPLSGANFAIEFRGVEFGEDGAV